MHQTLFDVDSADPLIYLVVAVLLLLVAEFASWVPAPACDPDRPRSGASRRVMS